MKPTPAGATPAPPRTRRQRRQVRRKRRLRRFLAASGLTLLLFCGALAAAGFVTPWGRQVRLSIAETIIATRHFYLARYITTSAEYASLVKQLRDAPVLNTGVSGKIHVSGAFRDGPIQIIPVSQQGYNGWVMLVHDPRLVRLVRARVSGSMGEYITDMAPRVGAVAGVNASGFEDPNGNGWGGIPVGLEMVDGHVFHPMKDDPSWAVVGFTRSGIMVMGHYTVDELRAMGVRDAMQFHPELVVDGKPMITVGDGGWGHDPRTAIGQAADGTVIFVVINGRLHNGSIGASQRQVMDLMLKYGAVNACAMDGGSSSVLYYAYGKNRILNSPSTIDPRGERHLPDAWLVFPSEQAADGYRA
ncbi:MAG: phosphodiester glycosidase family protein [Alicyclobacillaceae bacterium]|nr:phosphodiester glycosidase family protein [Alicyclobacillaceae bacterium]